MRLTQGTFSFLPDFTDDQITAQIRYGLEFEWSMSVEYSDDPHPRNAYWEMWGQPLFDLTPDDSDVVLREVRACREAHPNMYIKLIAYDAARGRQTTALSFIVNRPMPESRFRLERVATHDRVQRYVLRFDAIDRPAAERNAAAANGAQPNGTHP